jgi:hypothetical protein
MLAFSTNGSRRRALRSGDLRAHRPGRRSEDQLQGRRHRCFFYLVSISLLRSSRSFTVIRQRSGGSGDPGRSVRLLRLRPRSDRKGHVRRYASGTPLHSLALPLDSHCLMLSQEYTRCRAAIDRGDFTTAFLVCNEIIGIIEEAAGNFNVRDCVTCMCAAEYTCLRGRIYVLCSCVYASLTLRSRTTSASSATTSRSATTCSRSRTSYPYVSLRFLFFFFFFLL